MALESKKRLDSLISFINTKLGINATDITEAIQALLDEEYTIIDKSVKKISNHKLTIIREYVFYSCDSLVSAVFSHATIIGRFAFEGCLSLESADFPSVTRIQTYAFSICESLKIVVLRKNAVVSLDSTTAFRYTPIEFGNGYIYVPRSLVDSYKSATNWVKFADQFRALEDYTVDGTITGALDESKI